MRIRNLKAYAELILAIIRDAQERASRRSKAWNNPIEIRCQLCIRYTCQGTRHSYLLRPSLADAPLLHSHVLIIMCITRPVPS